MTPGLIGDGYRLQRRTHGCGDFADLFEFKVWLLNGNDQWSTPSATAMSRLHVPMILWDSTTLLRSCREPGNKMSCRLDVANFGSSITQQSLCLIVALAPLSDSHKTVAGRSVPFQRFM
jgi:hypothetical protein